MGRRGATRAAHEAIRCGSTIRTDCPEARVTTSPKTPSIPAGVPFSGGTPAGASLSDAVRAVAVACAAATACSTGASHVATAAKLQRNGERTRAC